NSHRCLSPWHVYFVRLLAPTMTICGPITPRCATASHQVRVFDSYSAQRLRWRAEEQPVGIGTLQPGLVLQAVLPTDQLQTVCRTIQTSKQQRHAQCGDDDDRQNVHNTPGK